MKKKIQKPICPLCNKEMHVVKYKGYYDSFVYWECSCRDEDLEKLVEDKWRGDYE